MGEFAAWTVSGAGTIALALLAGAGGSALLELLWRPRRDRRRAAAIIVAEVALNTELLLLQAHARMADLKKQSGRLPVIHHRVGVSR